ncbi:BTAD domain-containing putative transcriptional regulator [Dactylosporangium sp. NPDC006015]|uniref:BTAD domain-containing putative transcriptional regulator n=1 Tax=Dactylosporangium sp. NPDC006015 TaxID=3154576 RepID=UPI0033B3F774
MAPDSHRRLLPIHHHRRLQRRHPWRTRSNLDRVYARRITAAVAGAAGLLAVLIGLPVALLIVQRALCEAFDAATAVTRPLSPQVLLLAAVAAGWLLWTWLVIATIADIAAALTRSSRRPQLLPAPLRAVVTALASSVIAAVTTTDPAAAAAPSPVTVFTHAANPTATPLTPVAPNAVTALPTLASTVSATPQATSPPPRTVTVRSGDCLWNIAKQQLGDSHRWPELFNANKGRVQANGYALTNPNELHIGWTLTLPTTAAATPAASEAEPADPTNTNAPAETAPATPGPSDTAATKPSDTTSPAPPSGTATATSTADSVATDHDTERHDDQHPGVRLPSQGWISLSLAATIAAIAGLLRLQRRRHARLHTPIPVQTGPTRTPVPAGLAIADSGCRDGTLNRAPKTHNDEARSGPAAVASIGVNAAGTEISLFTLPHCGLALNGPGAVAVARAVLGSTLATILGNPAERPVIITTPGLLARLFPDGPEVTGLDPLGTTYDGERLLVLADTTAAVTRAEEELIGRRRLLDTYNAESITDFNSRTDHAESQPPCILLIEADSRYTGRVAAVAAQSAALQLHIVVLGNLDGLPTVTVTGAGTVAHTDSKVLLGGRLATLTDADLRSLLTMIADAAARPEAGTDIGEFTNAKPHDKMPAADLHPVPDLPTSTTDSPTPVRLTVLGPVTLTTDAGPITTGMRTGSYAVLALLAAYPHGRTLDQITADLHPDIDPAAAIKRVRTDINTTRRVLRAATGNTTAMFIEHDPASHRYRIDPNLVDVDLWRMLAAIGRANTAADDPTALTALHEAADLYAGDFAENQDRAWITDYATTHRHQILSVYARIAELLEPDQPDAAIAALETAARLDPVNEELYQRIMRIHGRHHRPDAVRRTLRRLEAVLAELGDAEPSDTTRRLAERQLRPTPAGARP